MEELKRCPFCGGKVAIAEGSMSMTKWLFITRAQGENKCTCRVFMESEEYRFDCPEEDKKEIKADLIEAWNKRYKEG